MNETQATHWSGAISAVASRTSALTATGVLAGLALCKLIIQFAGIRHYGIFRDELYYLACGQHLAWGYIDQPPLIAVVAWFERHAFGSSLISVRLLPVLAGAAVVFLTGILARELGGGRFAQFLAALTMLLAPAFLAFDSFLSMNAFEPVFWLGCAVIAVRIAKGATPKLWLGFGLLAGIGLENKHTMLVFGFGMMAGLILSGNRRVFRSRWIWIAGAVALAVFLPNLIWEARHGWPQVEVVRNAQLYKNEPISPLRFLGEQIAYLNPVALPVWLGGLLWLFFSRAGKRFRFLGWAYLLVLIVFIAFQGKSYYPLPFYPVLVAAGGVVFESVKRPRAAPWLRIAFPTVLIISALVALPFGVPVLPIDTFIRYSQLLPYSKAVTMERDAVHVELPQLYADMFGWDTLAATVANVYRSLPASERSDCAVLGGNYGESGAIDFYGPALGLPKAIGGHNSYFYWGPRGYSGSCVILFGERSNEFITFFRDVRVAAVAESPHAMPNERHIVIYVCRNPKEPLAALWPRFKMII